MTQSRFGERAGFLLCAAFLSLTAFLLVPPAAVSEQGVTGPWAVDEANYWAHATAVLYGGFSYERETASAFPPNHAMGPPLLAMPFLFVGSLIDRAADNVIVDRRSRESIENSWTGFAFSISSQAYLLAGAFFLYLTLKRGLQAPAPAFTTALSVLASGVPHYAYIRPVGGHAYEFALLSLGMFLIWGIRRPAPSTQRHVMITVIAALLFLARYNDLPLSLALIWANLALTYEPFTSLGWMRNSNARFTAAAQVLSLAAVVLAVTLFSYALADYDPLILWNAGTVGSRVFSFKGVWFYFERTWHVFFGKDWALFVTAPLVLLGLAWCRRLPGRSLCVPFLLGILANFFVVLSWGTQASGYGYRYLIPSAVPLATLGLSRFIDQKGRAARLWLCAAIAMVPFHLMVIYGTIPSLMLKAGTTAWNAGWVNNDFLPNAARWTFDHPLRMVNTMFLRLVAPLLSSHMPPDAVVKYIVVIFFPLVAGWALSRFFDRKPA